MRFDGGIFSPLTDFHHIADVKIPEYSRRYVRYDIVNISYHVKACPPFTVARIFYAPSNARTPKAVPLNHLS